MALPIDTTRLTVVCGMSPEAVLDRDTGQPKSNQDGEALFRTELVVMGEGRSQVVSVRTANEPKGIATGTAVRVTGFTVSTFTAKDGGNGIFYEAAAIEPAKPLREAS